MAIVYQHRRNDTNCIFYIGIGKTISRPYSKAGRNRYWWNIVNKVGYSIEILVEDCSYEQAQLMEKELIQKIGRADLGLGELVNMTDGGDSNSTTKNRKRVHRGDTQLFIRHEEVDEYLRDGWILGHTKITKEKIGSGNKGKKVSEETKIKQRKPKSLEARLNIKKAAQKRKPHSEETKKLMSFRRKGKPKSEAWKQKVRCPKGPQHVIECPNCGLLGGISNMKRYHFENCKK